MNSIIKFLAFVLLGTGLISLSNSCKKDWESTTVVTPGITSMDDLRAEPTFLFRTDTEVQFEVSTKDNQDAAIPGVRIDVYSDFPDSGGMAMMSFLTDANGIYSGVGSVPTYMENIVLGTDFIGLPSYLKVSIQNGVVNCDFGGSTSKKAPAGPFFLPPSPKSSNWTMQFMGSYNTLGVPSYLEMPNSVVSTALLEDINATLPERQPVPTYHPNYLANGNQTDLIVTQPSDVWITFVHEGAGYKNTLGFYTYNLSNPPTSVNNISVVKIIFPNLSFTGSGGGLSSGNKVKIGTFPANTGIGWVLIADGFKGNTISGNWTFYSNPAFNPESNPALRQHNVILSDPGRDLVLIGFEDIKRDAGTDNDFNDAIFYVKSNPITAISGGNYPVITYTSPDTDGDGVANTFDDYPNDANKAFNNYYPSQGAFASLAYEDMWPTKGDYDMNDMVIDYNINQVTNAQNKVVNIKAKYVLKAIGASFKNGFGVQLGVPNSKVGTVTGQQLSGSIISLNGQNLEQGQSKATFIVFDNAYKILEWPGGGTGVNTTPGAPYVQPDTITMNIPLTAGVLQSELGTPPYNPFIFVNQDRRREVHLCDMPPTSLANTALFGTANDNSNPAIGRYYRTANNLPWAINIYDYFEYPIEKAPIISGYTKFANWTTTSGSSFPDWYKNIAGYRVTANIFQQ
jgi:LruC domain-containing protein